MTRRTRYRDSISPPRTGFWNHGGNPPYIVEYFDELPGSKCQDVIGMYGKDNPFTLSSYEGSGCYLYNDDGHADFPIPSGVLRNFADSPSIGSSNKDVNRILSQSGPLTPKLYLPVSIFELRDIPHMLKHAGDLLHKISSPFKHRMDPVRETASATLAYQFGWQPLIEDIGKMIKFGDIVKKRQLTLLRAHSSRGINRRVTVHKDVTNTLSGRKLIHSTWGLLFAADYHSISTANRWATIRWKVRDQSQVGRIPSWNEAFRTAYGLNLGHIPIEIWKALPWSWAADWFLDLSNILAANYNMIYYKPTSLNVMTHYESVCTWSPRSQDSWHFTGGKMMKSEKFRVQQNPVTSLSLRLPFLDSFKLSILGSMSALRISRG